jgi:hypothetical protein
MPASSRYPPREFSRLYETSYILAMLPFDVSSLMDRAPSLDELYRCLGLLPDEACDDSLLSCDKPPKEDEARDSWDLASEVTLSHDSSPDYPSLDETPSHHQQAPWYDWEEILPKRGSPPTVN